MQKMSHVCKVQIVGTVRNTKRVVEQNLKGEQEDVPRLARRGGGGWRRK